MCDLDIISRANLLFSSFLVHGQGSSVYKCDQYNVYDITIAHQFTLAELG